MNCDNDEVRATKETNGVRPAYEVIYENMEKYMDLYNNLEEDINSNYYSKEKILEALGVEYENQDLSEDRICDLIKCLLKEKRRVEKELERIKQPKVTEKELKEMIMGMLE